MASSQAHSGHDHCGDHHHGHHHVPAGSDGSRLAIAFAVIFIFMIVEIFGGIISGSLALLADAGHMATDAAALLLALTARWLSRRKARADVFPFGLRRAQVLAGFVNAVALIVLTGWLVWEAVSRFLDPQPILSGTMLIVAIAGLVANLVAFAVLHGGSKHDLNLRGALLHVIGDILGSIAAIASALIIALTGFVQIDPILTLLVSALILRAAWPLLSEASHILLQGAPSNIDCAKMIKMLTDGRVPGLKGVHQLKVWMLTPDDPQLAMHVDVTDPAAAPAALKAIKEILHSEFGIRHSTIQIECEDCPDSAMLEEDALSSRTVHEADHALDKGGVGGKDGGAVHTGPAVRAG